MKSKPLLLLLIIITILPIITAEEIQYQITLNGKNADAIAQLTLESNKKVNFFQASLLLPEGADVIEIRDSKGVVEDFTLSSGLLEFKTNYSIPKTKETVQIEMTIKNARTEDLSPLYYSNFSLPAFQDSKTTVEITVPGLLSFETLSGFTYFVENDTVTLTGTGPASIKMYYSTQGVDTDYFKFFNFSSLSDSTLLKNGFTDAVFYFPIIEQITGIRLPFEKFPIVVFNELDYNNNVNQYSKGVYRTGGIIFIRENAFKENAAPVIIHESTHVLNAQVFTWNSSNSAWFDEGSAKIAEYFVKKSLGEKIPNLFYKNLVYRKGNTQYTIFPNSSMEELSNYYSNQDFMHTWHPSDEEVREFGYAFSELALRKYIQENGFSTLREKYREFLEIDKREEDPNTVSNQIISILNLDFTPCKNSNDLRVKECLNSANEFNIQLDSEYEVLLLGKKGQIIDTPIIPQSEIEELKKDTIREKITDYKSSAINFLEKAFLFISEKTLSIIGG